MQKFINVFCLIFLVTIIKCNAQDVNKITSDKKENSIHFYSGISPLFVFTKIHFDEGYQSLNIKGVLLGLNIGIFNYKIGSYSSIMLGGTLLIPIFKDFSNYEHDSIFIRFKSGFSLNGGFKIYFQEYESRYPNFYAGICGDLQIVTVNGSTYHAKNTNNPNVWEIVRVNGFKTYFVPNIQIGFDLPIGYVTKLDCGFKVGYGTSNTLMIGLTTLIKF